MEPQAAERHAQCPAQTRRREIIRAVRMHRLNASKRRGKWVLIGHLDLLITHHASRLTSSMSHVALQHSISQTYGSRRTARDIWIMGYHNQGFSLAIQVVEQFQNLRSRR